MSRLAVTIRALASSRYLDQELTRCCASGLSTVHGYASHLYPGLPGRARIDSKDARITLAGWWRATTTAERIKATKVTLVPSRGQGDLDLCRVATLGMALFARVLSPCAPLTYLVTATGDGISIYLHPCCSSGRSVSLHHPTRVEVSTSSLFVSPEQVLIHCLETARERAAQESVRIAPSPSDIQRSITLRLLTAKAAIRTALSPTERWTLGVPGLWKQIDHLEDQLTHGRISPAELVDAATKPQRHDTSKMSLYGASLHQTLAGIQRPIRRSIASYRERCSRLTVQPAPLRDTEPLRRMWSFCAGTSGAVEAMVPPLMPRNDVNREPQSNEREYGSAYDAVIAQLQVHRIAVAANLLFLARLRWLSAASEWTLPPDSADTPLAPGLSGTSIETVRSRLRTRCLERIARTSHSIRSIVGSAKMPPEKLGDLPSFADTHPRIRPALTPVAGLLDPDAVLEVIRQPWSGESASWASSELRQQAIDLLDASRRDRPKSPESGGQCQLSCHGEVGS